MMFQSVILLLCVVSTQAIIGSLFDKPIEFKENLKDKKFDCADGPQKATISWEYKKDADKWESFKNKEIKIWLMRDVVGSNDKKVVLLGSVNHPTTTFDFEFPGEFPSEWSSSQDKGAHLLNNGEAYSVFFYLESVENAKFNSKNEVLSDPDFTVTCCKAGNTNCKCSGSLCNEKDAKCVDGKCEGPNGPVLQPADPRTNLMCARPGSRVAPEGDICGKPYNGQPSMLACRATPFGTKKCQPCLAGSSDCKCNNQQCESSRDVCFNGRCVPNTGCESCPCEQGVCNPPLICVNNVCTKLPTSPPNACPLGSEGCPCATTVSGVVGCTSKGLVCRNNICQQDNPIEPITVRPSPTYTTRPKNQPNQQIPTTVPASQQNEPSTQDTATARPIIVTEPQPSSAATLTLTIMAGLSSIVML